MFVALSNLGPIVPFVGVGVLGIFIAIPLAALAVQRITHQLAQVVIGIVVAVLLHLLWGTSVGEGTSAVAGGLTAYTHAGFLNYLTITSHQPTAQAAWSHSFNLHVTPLITTIFLTVTLCLVTALIFRGRQRTQVA